MQSGQTRQFEITWTDGLRQEQRRCDQSSFVRLSGRLDLIEKNTKKEYTTNQKEGICNLKHFFKIKYQLNE